MLPFGKDKAHKEWVNWLKKREALNTKVMEVNSGLLKYRELEKSKGNEAFYMRREALETLGISHKNSPESGLPNSTKLRNMLSSAVKNAEGLRDRGQAFDINIAACRAMHTKLDSILQEKASATKNIESLEIQLQTTEERLREHEDNPPDAGHAALKAFDDELAALDKERSRVESAINSQTPNGEETDQAERDVAAAQEKLDALEAAAALGESSDEAQQKASGVLTRARNKLEESKAAKARREAAKRGLNRKLEEIEQKRSALADERAEVAKEVYLDDLADAENQLLDMLTHADLHGLVKKINETRELVNLAFNHGNGDAEHIARKKPHSPLTINIDIKHLVALENAKELNRAGIRL